MTQDFVLYDRVKSLEKNVDSLSRELYDLKLQMNEMSDQIKKLKEKKNG